MASLLVIGGTGFLGKSILDMFQRGRLDPWKIDHVLVMSRNVQSIKSEAPSLLSNRVELISCDVATCREIAYADYVIHAAASTDVRNYLTQPAEERQNILASTLNYCHLAKEFHRKSKILFVSSGAVYGNQLSDIERISEDCFANSLLDMQEGKRDYAIAKHDAEESFKMLAHKGMLVSVARCFSFVGKWLPRDRHFAIGNFIADGLAGNPITMKATYEVYRSYMYADDLVEWLMRIADYSNPQCPIFNVGSDQPVLMGELARMVANEFEQMANIPEILSGQTDRYVPSTNKIRNLLGVEMKYNLLSSIQATIAAIRSAN